ncbi:MAG: hypothetical protein DRP02_11830 [Candidatus Gerdarchaeota archaeon]|nr:MAG: hypothetical protein DRP02_11830 [Candidatus Gerdarchaeota archaeon]
MEDFTEKLINDIQHAIIKQVKQQNFIDIKYDERKKLPSGFIEKAWNNVDWDSVLEALKPEMEKRICNSVIGAMEAEIKTDVKKLMCVSGVRDKLRMEVYPKLMKVLDREED